MQAQQHQVGRGGADRCRALPVLESLGSVRHCGDLSSGAALKLVANTALAAPADTMIVAGAVGADVEAALSVAAKGALSARGAGGRCRAAGGTGRGRFAHEARLDFAGGRC